MDARSTSATRHDVTPGAVARTSEPPARERPADERIEYESQDEKGLEDEFPADELSLKDTIARLIASAREMVDAEMAWAKARAAFVTASAKTILIFGAVGFFLAFGLVVAVLVGAMLVLTPYIGAALALLVVMAGGLCVIGLCALVVRAQVRRIMGALK